MQAVEGQLDLLREPVVAFFEIFLKVVSIGAREGSKSGQHFVEDVSEGPNIDFAVISVTLENFWCHIQRCTELSLCKIVSICLKLLGEAQIRDHNFDIPN